MAGKFNLAEHIRAEELAQIRDIESITAEILDAKRTGGEAILTIGRGLMEAKALLPHGEWLPWLTERVEFSERSAQNFMRLAREWSNPQTLADLGASKALALLALPEGEREEFISTVHVVDGEGKTAAEMTSRELAQTIKERDEARMEAEKAVAEQRAAETARDEIARQMQVANDSLAEAGRQLEQAQRELAELRARPVEVAVEQVADPVAIAKARAEAEAGMQAKVDKAKAAKEKADAEKKAAEEALNVYQARVEELEKKLKRESISTDKDVAAFQVLFQQTQENVNKMQGMLLKARGREDQRTADAIQKALLALAEAVRGCVA